MDKGDVFGNLKDWGRVLDTLESLTNQNRLDECQAGLIRILRYKDNWRLREAVLECVGRVKKPGHELMREVMGILADEDTYYDMRILAATALGELIRKTPSDIQSDSGGFQCKKLIKSLIESPQPPIFHEALRKSLKSIDNYV